MRISVIIPAYNEEKYIGRCLEALKRQEYDKEYEIIVADNSSTDRTGDIAREFGAKVAYEAEKGISKALMRGVTEAEGEIFIFTDADSEAPPMWLKTIDDIFGENLELAAAGGPYCFYDAPAGVNKFMKKIIFPGWKVAANGILPCVNFAVRREAYHRVGGFNPKINWGQDIDISKRLKKSGGTLFETDIFVMTSFRRYSGGYENDVMAFANAVKELAVQLGRCYLAVNFGAEYEKPQKDIR